MKITVKSRITGLLPSCAYGNITLESAVELTEEIDLSEPDDATPHVKSLQKQADRLVLDDIQEQRKTLDELDKEFFSIKP